MTEKQIEALVRAIANALKQVGLTCEAGCSSSEPRRQTGGAPLVVVCLCAGGTGGCES